MGDRWLFCIPGFQEPKNHSEPAAKSSMCWAEIPSPSSAQLCSPSACPVQLLLRSLLMMHTVTLTCSNAGGSFAQGHAAASSSPPSASTADPRVRGAGGGHRCGRQVVLASCQEKPPLLGGWKGVTFLSMDRRTLRHCISRGRLCFVMFR